MEDHIYQWGKKHKNQWGSYMFDDFFECPKNICEKICRWGLFTPARLARAVVRPVGVQGCTMG